MKKTISFITMLILIFTLCVGCSSKTSAIPTETTQQAENSVTQEIKQEDNIDYGYTNYTANDYPLIPIPEADTAFVANGVLLDKNRNLTNPFDLYNDKNVEKIPYTDIVPLMDYIETTEYGYNIETETGELRLYQGADVCHMGWIDDVLVGDIRMVGETISWQFRAETVDHMENRSGIIIPNIENIEYSEYLDSNEFVKEDWYSYAWWSDETPHEMLMIIVYFPESQHQYTFYTKDIGFNEAGDDLNYKYMPSRLVETFADGHVAPIEVD